jgi:putative thioredoxin
MADSQWIIDIKTETFEADVVVRSQDCPVVVDFWAPWCGPCRELVPLLEKLAVEYDGKFILAKVNVDECPEIAGAFGVQSIPVVVAMQQGQPVNQFMGPMPEAELRKWFETFMPSPVDELLEQGRVLEESDSETAETKFRKATLLDPDRADAAIGLARVLLSRDHEQEVREIIGRLEARGYLEPEAERLKAQLELRDSAEESGGVQAARDAAAAAPDDLTLQVKLADALAVDRKFEESCEVCLAVIQKDKYGVGAEAKETMVRILDMVGPQSEFAGTYRRRLATAFY